MIVFSRWVWYVVVEYFVDDATQRVPGREYVRIFVR